MIREFLTGIITCAGLTTLLLSLRKFFPASWKNLANELFPINISILKYTASIAFLYNTFELIRVINYHPGSTLFNRGEFFWMFYLLTSVVPLLLWWKKISTATLSLLLVGCAASVMFLIPLYFSLFSYNSFLVELQLYSGLYYTTLPWAILLYMLLYWLVLFML